MAAFQTRTSWAPCFNAEFDTKKTGITWCTEIVSAFNTICYALACDEFSMNLLNFTTFRSNTNALFSPPFGHLKAIIVVLSAMSIHVI